MLVGVIPHSLGLSSTTFFNFSPSFFSYLHLLLSFFSYIMFSFKPHSPNQPTTMLASSSTLQPHALSSSSPLLPKLPRTLPLFSPLLRSSTRPRPNLLAFASAYGETTHRVIEEQTGTGKRGNEGVVNMGERREEEDLMEKRRETFLYSVAPYPLLFAAALPGASTVRSIFGPFVELVKTWNLPGWLVHWGHPGNMAVVLFAMGGYGTYLGFRIRFSDNAEEKAMAKDLHPKLLAGMFFFFALGATGGVTALLTSDKPILESPHAITGLIGLSLLTVQTILPALFEGNPGLRTVHGLLGSSIMTLFLVHAALGLQLGLSF